MPALNDVGGLVGLFKDAWRPSVIYPFAFMTPIVNDCPVNTGVEPQGAMPNGLGGTYHVPVMLSLEGGISMTAPRVTPAAERYIAPRAQAVPDAQIQGFNIHGRSQLTYEAAARSVLGVLNDRMSEDDRNKAVRSGTRQVVMGLGRSNAKRIETLALHGQRGLGIIEGVGTVQTSVVYEGVSGFALDVSITADEWSEGIWSLWEGSSFDVADVVGGTRQNTADNTVLGNGQDGLILIAINPAAPVGIAANGRILRFWHSTNSAAGVSAPAANRVLYFESGLAGATMGTNEFLGLDVFARNTGLMFGLTAAQYSMWGGNFRAGVGNIKLGALIEAISPIINAGVAGMTLRAVVPTQFFSQLANDQASLRNYDVDWRRSTELTRGLVRTGGLTVEGAVGDAGSGSQGTGNAINGFHYLSFLLQGNNELQILGHPFQKAGKIIVYPVEELHRIGAQDVNFVGPGDGSPYTLHVANSPSTEIRTYGNFAFYPDVPKHFLVLDGVTY